MLCPKCGSDNLEDAKLCQSCGQPIAQSQTPTTKPKTSKLAIWSLVLSILGLPTCAITIIPAMICGVWGLVKIRKSGKQLKGTGLAITGIALSVVITIFMLMLLIYAIYTVQKMFCVVNLNGLGEEMMCYTNDYNDIYPSADKWCDLLAEKAYVSKSNFWCPSSKEKFRMSSYAFNLDAAGKKTSEIPPDMVLIFETNTPGWNITGGRELFSTKNHYNGSNVLFADGHVKFIKDPNSLRWTAE